jgi:multidrug resistance efflux pump
MRTRFVYIAAAAGVAAALITVLIVRRKPLPGAAPKQTAAVQAEPSNEITLQGKIRPQHLVGVAPNVSGFIEAFLVEPGQEVYQGQVLARIGAQGLESAREAATAALEHAQEQVTRDEAAVSAARLEASRSEADAQRSKMALDRLEKVFTRQRMLFHEGATPRLTYEKAAAEYEAAQKEHDIMETAARTGRERVQSALNQVASTRKMVESKSRELDDAQAELAGAEIRSPVDGFVVSRKGEAGKPADGIGEDFFRIATDLYALEIELEPKSQDLNRFIPGMPALVLVLDIQSGAMEGRVKEVKDGKVIVEFGSASPAIKPGMMADVRFRWQ